MVQRGQRTSLEERIEIGERREPGQTDPQIAIAIGRPLPTVRKWRRKYQQDGRSCLASRLGKPTTGALRQLPLEIQDAVRKMRESLSGWRPLTIRVELEDDQRLTNSL
jgi:transposase-like protein